MLQKSTNQRLFLHLPSCEGKFDICQANLSTSGRSTKSMPALLSLFLRFQYLSLPSNLRPNLGVKSERLQMMSCSWLGDYQCLHPENKTYTRKATAGAASPFSSHQTNIAHHPTSHTCLVLMKNLTLHPEGN